MPIHCFASDDSLGQKSDYRPLAVVPRILTSSLNTATREAPSAPVGAVEGTIARAHSPDVGPHYFFFKERMKTTSCLI